jgi:putative membrane protein
MSNDQKDSSNSKRTGGRIFDIGDEVVTQPESNRNARIFTPDNADTIMDIPEAITAGQRLPNQAEYESIGLASRPLKGFKTFLYGLGLLALVSVTAEFYSMYQYTAEIHSFVAIVYLILLILVLGLGLRALANYLRDPDNLLTLNDIQVQASRLQEERTFDKSKSFIERLGAFYAGKPHALHFQRCIDQLPNYNDDRETVDHIERVFLEPLDNEAIRRISNHCLQIGTLVAASPYAAMDMLISFWRSLKMIDEISEVYGLRPSMPNRLKLLKSVARQMILVGTSQLVLDKTVEALGAKSLAALAGARVGQGIGVAMYTARIGIAAMRVTRPIECAEAKLPSSSDLIGPMLKNLKKLVANPDS